MSNEEDNQLNELFEGWDYEYEPNARYDDDDDPSMFGYDGCDS